jgi:hypothetical protein
MELWHICVEFPVADTTDDRGHIFHAVVVELFFPFFADDFVIIENYAQTVLQRELCQELLSVDHMKHLIVIFLFIEI